MWISADGSVSESVLDTNSGIRYYIHRDKGNVWRSGGSAGSLVTYSGFEFEIINDIIMVKMPWSSLNINVPVANGNTAIGIKIQYIDGADQSWASSDGSKDQSVKVKSLFSF